jgi:hypothetical protein
VEVISELPDSAEVGLVSALAQAGELEVLVHLLAECGGRADPSGLILPKPSDRFLGTLYLSRDRF